MNEKTQYEKTMNRRAWLLFFAAFLLVNGTAIAAGLLPWDHGLTLASASLTWLLFGASLGLIVLNVLLCWRFERKLQRMPVGTLQEQLQREKDNAEEVSARLLRTLRLLRMLGDLYAVLMGLLGIGIVGFRMIYSANASSGGDGALMLTILLEFYAMYLLTGALSRIRFPMPRSVMGKPEDLLSWDEFPVLYGLARKARDAMGCKGEIIIDVNGDFNCGIAKVGETYLITIGVILLHFHSEEELYTVLLHEFGHMVESNAEADREKQYAGWLDRLSDAYFFSPLTQPMFRYVDGLYGYQMAIYLYVCSVLHEESADIAQHCGSAAHAASSVLKMKYYDLFSWERGTVDGESSYASEVMELSPMRREISEFAAAMETEGEKWRKLTDLEIPARNSTHPTAKMRLDALGVENPAVLPMEDSPMFREEKEKAVRFLDDRIERYNPNWYEETRRERYLLRLQTVTQWEEAGKPLEAERYGDVDRALRMLGRCSEANALCERAIAELPTAAAVYAYFMRGCHRLRAYDARGVDDLYFAMENNSNCIDEGLATIGQFCCLTGNLERLELYRKRAVEIGQRDKDVYSEMNHLGRRDRLVAEQQLPEELRRGLLARLEEADSACVENVYLVRKIITEDFFVTAVIVRFAKGAAFEEQDALMSKLFRYLDTCSDWQFALFDYDEVKRIKPERIAHSCVYQKERDKE